MSTITDEQINITPKWATDVMEAHWRRVEKGQFVPRPVSIVKVAQYVMDMKNGDWMLTPDPIMFDINGDLVQGQHRLEAVRRSGCTIPMRVSRGWPTRVMEVLDTGKSRSVGSILHMGGHEHGAALAGTLGVIARIAFRGHVNGLSAGQAILMMKKFDIHGSIESLLRKSTSSRDYSGRTLGPLVWYHTLRPKKAIEFAESLFNFRTTANSPVAAYLIWAKAGGGLRKQSTALVIRAMCSAIKNWDDDRKMSHLRPTVEHIEWLANSNPKLRDWIRTHTTFAMRAGK
jgi:hypothetical protein